jgi:hypothetical protein
MQKSSVASPKLLSPWTPDTQGRGSKGGKAAGVSVPMITSNRPFGSFSYRRTSKFCGAPSSQYSVVRHSMLKMRLGALPVTEVKTPHVAPGKLAQPSEVASVTWSCHRAKMVLSYGSPVK